MSPEAELCNLLYRYAEHIDAGDFAGAAQMFKHAKLQLFGVAELQDYTELQNMLTRVIKVHQDGTPRTKHITVNPIISIEPSGKIAACRSNYIVLQKTETLQLQMVAAGRYRDEFELIEGSWRFRFRDFSLFDMPGEISEHLNF